MKRFVCMLTVVAVLLVFSSVSFAGLNNFAGTWKNVNTRTKGITKLVISVKGRTATVHAWGKCRPKDCDWGTVRARYYKNNRLKAAYRTKIATRSLVLTFKGKNRLKASVKTHYTDKSGRKDRKNTYTFKRAAAPHKVQKSTIKPVRTAAATVARSQGTTSTSIIAATSSTQRSTTARTSGRVTPAGSRTVTKPTITVINPNGGEVWEKGKQYRIRWTSSGVQGNVRIRLKWGTGSGGWYTVSGNTKNTGSYTYKVTAAGVGHSGNQFRLYVMTLNGKVTDVSNGPFTIEEKSGAVHLSPPVIKFTTPKRIDTKTKEIWVRGKSYTIRWKQVRKTNADLSYIKILLKNRKAGKSFWVTEGTRNRKSLTYRVPNTLPDGVYILQIMPKSEEFRNSSAEFYVGSSDAVDLVCEIRNVRVGWEKKNYFVKASKSDYIEFEIWVMNRGTKNLSMVPIAWRILNEPDNVVILQREAGFSNVYPNKYYRTKLKYEYKTLKTFLYWHKKNGWGKGPFRIEAEADPKHKLPEMEMVRGNNKARKSIFYNMHIKGAR